MSVFLVVKTFSSVAVEEIYHKVRDQWLIYQCEVIVKEEWHKINIDDELKVAVKEIIYFLLA